MQHLVSPVSCSVPENGPVFGFHLGSKVKVTFLFLSLG